MDRIDLLEKCSPGGYFLIANHVRNIVLSLNGITDLNNKDKVNQILLDIKLERRAVSENARGENLFLMPSEIVLAIFNSLYKGLLLDNFHLQIGVVDLLGDLTRKGKFHRSVTDEDKHCFIGEKSLYEAIEDIDEEFSHKELDVELRDESIQNITAMADFRKSIDDGSLGLWVRSWKVV